MRRFGILIACLFLFGCTTSVKNSSEEMALSNKNKAKRNPASTPRRVCGRLSMNNGDPFIIIDDPSNEYEEYEGDQFWFFADTKTPRHDGFMSILSHYEHREGKRPACFREVEIYNSGERRLLSNWSILSPTWYSSCLVAGTLISTPSGPVPIEDIKVGDAVLSFDGENVVESKVLKTMVTPNRHYGHINLPNGKTIGVTPEHPFYNSSTKDWFEIGNINGSQSFLELKDGNVHPVSATNTSFSAGHEGAVYNIEVDTFHNYFAEGILVHNK